MRVIVYSEVDGWLDAYASLVSEGQALGFDQTPEWFQAYVKHLPEQPGSSMMLGVVDEVSCRLLLGVPLLSTVSGRLSTRYLSALANYYTALFQPVFAVGPHSQSDVLTCFVSALGCGAVQWDEMSLEPMAGDAPFLCELRSSLDRHGYTCTITHCFSNWYLTVEGRSYAAYEESLPSKLRNTLQRKQRKLERELGAEIRIVQDGSDLDKFICDYEAVYQKSWKPEEGCPAFIRAIIHSFARNGWLRLGLMYVAGQPVAAQLWFVKDGTASIYKLSYDEQYGKYSVGTILTAAMMRRVIDIDHVGVVDFLTGDDVYKKEWMSHSQERYRIRIYNRFTWRGRMLAFWNTEVKRLLTTS